MNDPTSRAASRNLEGRGDSLIVGGQTIHISRDTSRNVLRHIQVAEDSRGQLIGWPRESSREVGNRTYALPPTKGKRNRPPRIVVAPKDVRHTCDICGLPETAAERGKIRRLAIDHDHRTGALREFLCSRCNTGIGMFLDKPETLRRAADYLAQPPGIATVETRT